MNTPDVQQEAQAIFENIRNAFKEYNVTAPELDPNDNICRLLTGCNIQRITLDEFVKNVPCNTNISEIFMPYDVNEAAIYVNFSRIVKQIASRRLDPEIKTLLYQISNADTVTIRRLIEAKILVGCRYYEPLIAGPNCFRYLLNLEEYQSTVGDAGISIPDYDHTKRILGRNPSLNWEGHRRVEYTLVEYPGVSNQDHSVAEFFNPTYQHHYQILKKAAIFNSHSKTKQYSWKDLDKVIFTSTDKNGVYHSDYNRRTLDCMSGCWIMPSSNYDNVAYQYVYDALKELQTTRIGYHIDKGNDLNLKTVREVALLGRVSIGHHLKGIPHDDDIIINIRPSMLYEKEADVCTFLSHLENNDPEVINYLFGIAAVPRQLVEEFGAKPILDLLLMIDKGFVSENRVTEYLALDYRTTEALYKNLQDCGLITMFNRGYGYAKTEIYSFHTNEYAMHAFCKLWKIDAFKERLARLDYSLTIGDLAEYFEDKPVESVPLLRLSKSENTGTMLGGCGIISVFDYFEYIGRYRSAMLHLPSRTLTM